jgi:ribose transport system substrate-binding protein
MAYSGADQLFRVIAGEPAIPAAEAFAPYRMFTPENATEATPPDYGFGDSYVQGYRDLWLDAPAS